MKFLWMIFILIYAAYRDIRERKIPNVLIGTGLLGICVFRYLEESSLGIAKMFLSFLLSVGVFLPLFFIHAIGAGDIKLFSLIAAMHGLKEAFQVCILWFLLSGVVSLWKLLFKRRFNQRLAYAWSYMITGRAAHMPYYDRKRDGTKDTIPLAPFLALAYAVAGYGRWKGIW